MIAYPLERMYYIDNDHKIYRIQSLKGINANSLLLIYLKTIFNQTLKKNSFFQFHLYTNYIILKEKL